MGEGQEHAAAGDVTPETPTGAIISASVYSGVEGSCAGGTRRLI